MQGRNKYKYNSTAITKYPISYLYRSIHRYNYYDWIYKLHILMPLLVVPCFWTIKKKCNQVLVYRIMAIRIMSS